MKCKVPNTVVGLGIGDTLASPLSLSTSTLRVCDTTLGPSNFAGETFADGESLVGVAGEDSPGNGFSGVGTAKVLSGSGFIAATISARF
jgi:hypothetical protein